MSDRLHLKLLGIVWLIAGAVTWFNSANALGLVELSLGGAAYIAAFFADRGAA